MKTLLKVISQSQPVTINTQNGGTTQKSVVVLQEMGGRFEDTYVASLLGGQIRVSPGEIVWASLRFSAHDYNGSSYQDITVQEIISLSKH